MNKASLYKCSLDRVMLDSVELPLIGGSSGPLNIPDWFKESIVCWYDPHRQGCTNENMVDKPVLKDLSGNELDVNLYNFAWTEECGITEDGAINFDGISSYGLQKEGRTKLNGVNGFTCIYARRFPGPLPNLVIGFIFGDNNPDYQHTLFSNGVKSYNSEFTIYGSMNQINKRTYGGNAMEWFNDNEFHFSNGNITFFDKGYGLIENGYPLVFGRNRTKAPYHKTFTPFCLHSFLLFNCRLSEKEVKWVENNLINYQNKKISESIRESLVAWYSPQRQGATNEKLSENPVLFDLSGNGHDMTCHNFAWTEKSGIDGDKLVFDGVDDYCSWVGDFHLVDATIIIKYKYDSGALYGAMVSKMRIFNCFGRTNTGKENLISFFGKNTAKIYFTPSESEKIGIIRQWDYAVGDERYNLLRGGYLGEYNNPFLIGRHVEEPLYAGGYIKSVLLFNRTLTDAEIEYVKQNMID